MIANQMRSEFKLLRDGASKTEMAFNDKEVSKFLTLAYYNYIETRLFSNRNRAGEGLDIGSKRDDDLKELKKYVYILPSGEIYDESDNLLNAGDDTTWTDGKYEFSKTVTLPSDILYATQEKCSITYNDSSYLSNVIPINEDEYNEEVQNPFRVPNYNEIWSIGRERGDSGYDDITNRTNKRIYLISNDGIVITKYRLSYVKKPQPIVCDILTPTNQRHCELNEVAQREIIDEAVRLSYGTTGSQKYQIGAIESSKHI